MNRVILFEENPSYRDAIREVLEGEGYGVVVDGDLTRAALVHDEAAVNVLVCGVNTEAELDVLKAIGSRLVPVVALVPARLEAAAVTAGVHAALPKPFGREAFSCALKRAKAHGDVVRAREAARLAFGEVVTSHIESRLGTDAISGEAGDDFADVLHHASEAFPNTSIAELVDAMMDGLIGGR